jgi:hypothetical protein
LTPHSGEESVTEVGRAINSTLAELEWTFGEVSAFADHVAAAGERLHDEASVADTTDELKRISAEAAKTGARGHDAASTYLYMDIVAKALFGFVALTSSRSLARLDDGAVSGDVVGAVGPTAAVGAD